MEQRKLSRLKIEKSVYTGLAKEDFESFKRLGQPLAHLEYKDEDKIEIKEGDLELSFEYKKLPHDLLLQNSDEIEELYERERAIVESMNLQPEKYRKVVSFHVKNKTNNLEIVLKNPFGCEIFFSPRKIMSEIKQSYGEVDIENKFIILKGDLATPLTIITLFHELGHVADDMEMNEQERKNFKTARNKYTKTSTWRILEETEKIKTPTEEELAIVLKSERNAWAFALKKLKPFLNDLKIKENDLLTYIHKRTLNEYSDKASKILEYLTRPESL